MKLAPEVVTKCWPMTGGECTWAELAQRVAGLELLWTDLDGLHLRETFPDTPPAGATHLWGWSIDRWIRARIDGDRVFLAELSGGKTEDPLGETVRICRGVLWDLDEARLSTSGRHHMAEFRDETAWTMTLSGTAPITFFHLGGRSW